MTLPNFNENGELPIGVYPATLEEVFSRFDGQTPQRQLVSKRLKRIFELAKRTEKLKRLIIFGSYVTSKPAPNDVDIILVMQDDFDADNCAEELKPLFDHLKAQKEFGASIFAIRPKFIFLLSEDDFIAQWQIKRDQTKRGIIEVIWEQK